MQAPALQRPADLSDEVLNNVASIEVSLHQGEKKLAVAQLVTKIVEDAKEKNVFKRKVFNPLVNE